MRLTMTVSLGFTFGILVAVAALILLVWNTGDVAHGATITMTKNADTEGTCTPTDCSLREALNDATAGDGIFVPFGVYTLTLGKALKMTRDVTLTGDTIIIQGDPLISKAFFRLLDITGGDVRIGGDVTIRNGSGIVVGAAGKLTLTDVTIKDMRFGCSVGGGGIHNSGTVTLVNTTVASNSISTCGSNDGGGIFNSTTATLTLINSTISNNFADEDGGGIKNHGVATITDSTVANNEADGVYGGASVTTAL